MTFDPQRVMEPRPGHLYQQRAVRGGPDKPCHDGMIARVSRFADWYNARSDLTF